MLQFFRQSVVFIAIGLLWTSVPEWQNNVLMNGEVSGWAGYLGTLKFNTVLLVLAYLLFRFLNQRYGQAKTLLLLFTLCGVAWLLTEWIFINHPPWSAAIQFIMFVYWGVVFSSPALFLLSQAKPVRSGFLLYILASELAMVVISLLTLQINPAKTLLLISIILSWSVVFVFAISFFLKAVGYVSHSRLLLTAAVLVPVAESALPFPFDFIIFLAAIGYGYFSIMRHR